MWEQFIDDWKSTRSNNENIADCRKCYCKNENMADCRKCYWRNICIRHNPFECSHFKKEYED